MPDLLMVAALGCLTATPIFAEPQSAAASPYRLNVESDAFRLSVPGNAADSPYRMNVQPETYRRPAPDGLTPAARKAQIITARLADKPYAKLIYNAALESGLELALVHAVIFVESGYDPSARSPKGAMGLMQVMPETALRYGIRDVTQSPRVNLRAGTLYLKDLMQQFNNRLDLVLAAYNAGENAVLRYGERIPPYPETQRYVPAVLAKYREFGEVEPEPETPRFDYLPGTRLDPARVRALRE